METTSTIVEVNGVDHDHLSVCKNLLEGSPGLGVFFFDVFGVANFIVGWDNYRIIGEYEVEIAGDGSIVYVFLIVLRSSKDNRSLWDSDYFKRIAILIF
jgi:hypothetical protein